MFDVIGKRRWFYLLSLDHHHPGPVLHPPDPVHRRRASSSPSTTPAARAGRSASRTPRSRLTRSRPSSPSTASRRSRSRPGRVHRDQDQRTARPRRGSHGAVPRRAAPWHRAARRGRARPPGPRRVPHRARPRARPRAPHRARRPARPQVPRRARVRPPRPPERVTVRFAGRIWLTRAVRVARGADRQHRDPDRGRDRRDRQRPREPARTDRGAAQPDHDRRRRQLRPHHPGDHPHHRRVDRHHALDHVSLP